MKLTPKCCPYFKIFELLCNLLEYIFAECVRKTKVKRLSKQNFAVVVFVLLLKIHAVYLFTTYLYITLYVADTSHNILIYYTLCSRQSTQPIVLIFNTLCSRIFTQPIVLIFNTLCSRIFTQPTYIHITLYVADTSHNLLIYYTLCSRYFTQPSYILHFM